LEFVKECVITHLPNACAPKMDGAKAGDLYIAIMARINHDE